MCEFLVNCILFVLKKNYFMFDDLPPNHRSRFRDNVVMYVRLIDDLLFIWRGGAILLQEFISFLNFNTFNLSFRHEYSPTSINYLELALYSEGKKIYTKLYRKPNGLLHAWSGHSRHCINNIPHGQFLWAKRNCTLNEHFEKGALTLHNRFLEKGYNEAIISRSYERAGADDVLAPWTKDKPNVVCRRARTIKNLVAV
ncbi:hypothetical protein XELAEV_18012437mg [Xenopus laevis]|uniref:Helix-turn-helix domain-containing protein n=1 Tax=Xenopus laevis TaxID=8355 RepID=A0A974DN38_XENLA|nr:hypothetical protein XELAEV_18012437mg [Xenopus laevis]